MKNDILVVLDKHKSPLTTEQSLVCYTSRISDSKQLCLLGFPNRFFTREEVVEEIEKRDHSAAGTLCNIARGVPFGDSNDDIVKDIIGIVALLGRVNSFPLSRLSIFPLAKAKILDYFILFYHHCSTLMVLFTSTGFYRNTWVQNKCWLL